MTDAEPLFIDTNILVYANVAESPFHQQTLSAIEAAFQKGLTPFPCRLQAALNTEDIASILIGR